MTETELKINQNDFNYFIYTEGIFKQLNVDEKIIVSKDLSEIKKKIIDGSLGKIVAEITNMSSNFFTEIPIFYFQIKTYLYKINKIYLKTAFFI